MVEVHHSRSENGLGIVMVNGNNIVGFGKAADPCNADVAASSTSYSLFVCHPVPLGRSFSQNSFWPRPLEQALGLKSVLMIFVWGLRDPKDPSEIFRVLGEA